MLSNSGDNRETLVVKAINEFVSRHPMKGGAASVGEPSGSSVGLGWSRSCGAAVIRTAAFPVRQVTRRHRGARSGTGHG